MSETARLSYLRFALRAFGVMFIFGLYPLTVLWPAGWAWHTGGRSEYLEMILAIYATLGVFLLVAARNPMQHLSLISFTIWSSVVHGSVMAVQSIVDPRHLHHLLGDVLGLFVVAVVLGFLSRSSWRLGAPKDAA